MSVKCQYLFRAYYDIWTYICFKITDERIIMERTNFIKRFAFKRVLILSGILLLNYGVYSQSADKSVKLEEIEVKAARVVDKADGFILYPTEKQKSSSTSGYSFLQKLFLPNLRVDDVSNSITVIDNRGGVQLRINGIVADKSAMLSLSPDKITKVDFIDNPGVRYGDGIAYVINIYTKRDDNGYSIGTDNSQALTAKNGNYNVFGKWNFGKNEISLNYGFGYSNSKGYRMDETADYHLNDGSVYTINRSDIDSHNKSFAHGVKLTYNLADSTNYQFQASLSGDFSKSPVNFNSRRIMDGADEYIARKNSGSKSGSPVLDLYYFNQFTPKQSVTVNAVGTYIGTSKSESYNEGAPYQYEVDGSTYSVLGEAIYENRMKPFTLSAGINFKYKHTDNEYIGDASSVNVINNTRIYGFTEIKGSIGKLRYTGGVGASYVDYSQQEHKYNDWLFCPKFSIAYNFTNGLQFSYTFQSNDRMSQIAMISDAMIRNNSMEWTKGSPDLKPSRDVYNTLRISYNTSRLQSFVQGFYKACHHPNMAVYERTEDDRFIYTQRNQKEIDALHVMGYLNYWLVPDKLSASVSGGLFRCFNFGDDYTHCYTSYFVTGSLVAYLGKFSLYAYADNGSRFLEGETKGYSGNDIAFKAAYSYKDWQFSVVWQKPFMDKYKMFESELLNRNLKKHSAMYSYDSANLVTLKVSWRINRGRQYQSAAKSINLKDYDTGILK